MDRFEAIAAFVAVADAAGFAAGSRRLGISPSAATRLVAGLEARLGVRLLNRTTRAVSLTDAGARFLERARRILADLDEAERMAEDERGAPAGRLVVTAPLVFGRLHAAPLVSDFMAAHPRVAVELVLADRVLNLVEDGIDVAIRIGRLPDSGDIARPIGATRRVLAASPAYLAGAGVPASPAGLAGHRLVSFGSGPAPRAWRFRRGDEELEIAVAPVLATNSADAAILHAVRGGGIASAFGYQVAEEVRDGRLCIVLADWEPPPSPIQLVWPSARLLSRKVRAFVELAVATRRWSFVAL